MKEDLLFVFLILVGGGIAAAWNAELPLWQGALGGFLAFFVIFSVDLLLKLLFPRYRRHRAKD